MAKSLILLARLAGFEPATYGLEDRLSKLPNLLILLEAFEIISFLFVTFYHVFTYFGTDLKIFHTQIHTQMAVDKSRIWYESHGTIH